MNLIKKVHGNDYINGIKEETNELKEKEIKGVGSSYLCNKSVEAGLHSASLGVSAIERLMNKEIESAYVLSRPPGHHSGLKSTIDGFCVFNNVAIAT
jgi:acetoin utilization deacetylase AcuC-like enzyme